MEKEKNREQRIRNKKTREKLNINTFEDMLIEMPTYTAQV
jgi:hypothetical protein